MDSLISIEEGLWYGYNAPVCPPSFPAIFPALKSENCYGETRFLLDFEEDNLKAVSRWCQTSMSVKTWIFSNEFFAIEGLKILLEAEFGRRVCEQPKYFQQALKENPQLIELIKSKDWRPKINEAKKWLKARLEDMCD